MRDWSDGYSYEYYTYTHDIIDYYVKNSGYNEYEDDESDNEFYDCLKKRDYFDVFKETFSEHEAFSDSLSFLY